MKFKKGDIVEVITKAYWDGLTYHVGTKWEVIGYGEDTLYYVTVSDPRQEHGYAPLFYDYIKKVDEEK